MLSIPFTSEAPKICLHNCKVMDLREKLLSLGRRAVLAKTSRRIEQMGIFHPPGVFELGGADRRELNSDTAQCRARSFLRQDTYTPTKRVAGYPRVWCSVCNLKGIYSVFRVSPGRTRQVFQFLTTLGCENSNGSEEMYF